MTLIVTTEDLRLISHKKRATAQNCAIILKSVWKCLFSAMSNIGVFSDIFELSVFLWIY